MTHLIEILQIVLLSFAFILAISSFRILNKEKRLSEPRELVISSINQSITLYVIMGIIITFLVGMHNLINNLLKEEEKIIQKIKYDFKHYTFKNYTFPNFIVLYHAKNTSFSLKNNSEPVFSAIDMTSDKLVAKGFRVFSPAAFGDIKRDLSEVFGDKTLPINRDTKGYITLLLNITAAQKPASDGYLVILIEANIVACDIITDEVFAIVTDRAKTITRGDTDYGVLSGVKRGVIKVIPDIVDRIIKKIIYRFTMKIKFTNVSIEHISRIFVALGWQYKIEKQTEDSIELQVFTTETSVIVKTEIYNAFKNEGIDIYLHNLETKIITFKGGKR